MSTSPAMRHGGQPARVRYFPRQLIKAADLREEQEYHREKLRRHNRRLHGWGVVCGFDVTPAPEADKPWRVQITPGYLLTPQGDEIAGEEAYFDVATCLLTSADPCAFARPCPPITRRPKPIRTLYLSVRAIECQARPERVAPVGCSCDDAECEYSRIIDAYEFCCLESLPGTHAPEAYGCDELCKARTVFPCRGIPTDPWVVLATITLPNATTTELTGGDIDVVTNRHFLYSTTMVQELARCLCQAT